MIIQEASALEFFCGNSSDATLSETVTQGLQNPLIEEYSFHHIWAS